MSEYFGILRCRSLANLLKTFFLWKIDFKQANFTCMYRSALTITQISVYHGSSLGFQIVIFLLFF